MKRIMSRSFLILIVTLAFFAGVCLLAFRLVTQSGDWVQQAFNGHIASSNGLAQAGTIYDRNDMVLAFTDADGNRVYNDDYATRCAMLHVVGDNSLNISTAVQSMYRGELTGYSFIWGLGMPNSLRTHNDIKLTVNSEASKAAYEALGSRKGACVVYNYKTSEILCSTSSLSYDPQNPPEINESNEKDFDGVYLDNVVSSTYTPGSIFKIVTSAAAIENIGNIYDRTFECTGEYEIGGDKITCEEAHGTINFKEAFAYSCNIAYAQMAVELGIDKMNETANKMGFNQSFDVSNIPLATSKYDVSNTNANQLAWSGIGQHEDLANPLHMAVMCGVIANGGTPVKPYLVSNDTSILSKLGLAIGGTSSERMISASTAEKLQDLMRGAADYYANSRGLSIGGLNFCAKTGTAEVGKDKEPNAWFVGYCEDDSHPYAFAVVVENGGYGISAATPVAQAAINVLVNNEK